LIVPGESEPDSSTTEETVPTASATRTPELEEGPEIEMRALLGSAGAPEGRLITLPDEATDDDGGD